MSKRIVRVGKKTKKQVSTGLSKNLDSLMRLRGLTRTEVAKRSGVARATIYNIIATNESREDLLIPIAKVLGTTAQELRYGPIRGFDPELLEAAAHTVCQRAGLGEKAESLSIAITAVYELAQDAQTSPVDVDRKYQKVVVPLLR